jgi:hypothetical protein
MRTSLLLACLCFPVVAAARLPERETPRATDLLQAEKLADRIEQRLRLPAKRGPGWRHGGGGWDVRGEPAAEESPPVRIDVRPPSRSRAR